MKKTALFGIGLLIAIALPVHAEDSPNATITYRKAVMESIGGHTSAIAAILKGDITDKTGLAHHANALALAAKTSEAAFRTKTEGQGTAETHAKPEIWMGWDDFKKKDEALVNSTQAFADKINSGMPVTLADFAPDGAACKACHQDYKK